MPEQQSVKITRVFDAPVSLVWKMWSDPEMIKKWWGPNQYFAPTAEMDFRVGGKYVFAMQGPNGKITYSGGAYKEIIDQKKIVTEDHFTDKEGNPVSPTVYGFSNNFPEEMTVTITFEEVDGKTTMTLVHEANGMEDTMLRAMEQGWSESLDKMETEVKNIS